MAVFKQGPRPEEDFTMISNALARNPEITIEAKGIYMFMRSHRDGWNMTVVRTAKALGVSKGRVSKYINELIDAGYIIRSQGSGEGGRFGEIEYLILTSPRLKNPDTVKPDTENPDTENRPTKEDYSSKKINPKKITSSSVDEPGQPDGFKDFWDNYPRKIGKGKAEEKYREQLETTTPDFLANAVKNFAAECRIQQTEKRYIPYPSTWLNQGRWKDYDVAPPATEKSEPSVDDIMTWEIDWDEEGGNAAGF